MYEVEKKFPILGWKLIYVDYGLYKAPIIFDSFEQAKNFIKPSEKIKLISTTIVFEQ